MSGFTIEKAVPVFRPHIRRDENGNALYEVTAADLAEIARNSNQDSIELHGSKPPHTQGHRKFEEDVPESEQPAVLGYCENFRVSTLPDKTIALLADIAIANNMLGTAKKHPYRSSEYNPVRKLIVGVARLTRPPALNLGAQFYPGTKDPIYVYSAGSGTVDETENSNAQTTPELTHEEQAGAEKLYRYLHTKYAWIAKCEAEFSKAEEPEKEPEGKPADEKKEKPVAKDDTEDYKAKYLELSQKHESTLVDTLIHTLGTVEGYQFDAKAEAKRMLPMTADERTARAEEIRKYSRKVETATATKVEVYQGKVETTEKTDGPATQEQAIAATAYAKEKNVTYAAALAAVMKLK